MNKLFIGLLIIAAGAGVFFFLRKENNTKSAISKDWIIGKWQVQPPNLVIDTTFKLYQYDFQKGGLLLQSLKDSISADTMHYEWNKISQLLWKQKEKDTTARVFNILQLTSDTLQIRGVDSVIILFTRVK